MILSNYIKTELNLNPVYDRFIRKYSKYNHAKAIS